MWHAQAPEKEAQRRWSYRISQLLIPDLDLEQIVAAWQLAIRDPAHMNVFCTDRLALPKSATQTLTPHDLQAAKGEYHLRTKRPEPRIAEGELRAAGDAVDSGLRFGGLDLGDQCWFVARSVDAKTPETARLLWVEAIAAERVRTRVPELFRALGLSVLCVDAGPLRDLARDLTFLLNDLDEETTISSNDPTRNIYFTSGGATLPLRWQAASERWEQVRCAPVEFTQREGQGLRTRWRGRRTGGFIHCWRRTETKRLSGDFRAADADGSAASGDRAGGWDGIDAGPAALSSASGDGGESRGAGRLRAAFAGGLAAGAERGRADLALPGSLRESLFIGDGLRSASGTAGGADGGEADGGAGLPAAAFAASAGAAGAERNGLSAGQAPDFAGIKNRYKTNLK